MTNTFLSRFDWRFATKQFDATKKITSEDLGEVERAIRFAPTSYGIQPFHVVRVDDPELRKKLRAVSYDQAQVTDASHFFVFCARLDVAERIDQYFTVLSGGSEEVLEKTKGARAMMHGALDALTGDTAFAWSARQAYLALGFGLAAAAELGVDTCPMEGFNPSEVDKILGLPAHIRSVAYMAVGHRSADPERPKFRFPKSDIIEVR